MMKFKRYVFLYLLPIVSFLSCGLDENEPYNLKFVHIMLNEASSTTVSCKAKVVGTYSVYLSCARPVDSIAVSYDIVIGAGLKEGVDYQMITTGNKLVFLPGIFDMPIRIQWLPNPIDQTKDNTIKIVLTSNDKGYTLGLPGPDQKQKEFTITKVQ